MKTFLHILFILVLNVGAFAQGASTAINKKVSNAKFSQAGYEKIDLTEEYTLTECLEKYKRQRTIGYLTTMAGIGVMLYSTGDMAIPVYWEGIENKGAKRLNRQRRTVCAAGAVISAIGTYLIWRSNRKMNKVMFQLGKQGASIKIYF